DCRNLVARQTGDSRRRILNLIIATLQPAPRSTLFPYTTLFRSQRRRGRAAARSQSGSREGSAITAGKSKSSGQRACHRRRWQARSEEHTSELQSLAYLVCRLLLEKKNNLDDANANSHRPCHAIE